jgi:hypothetical protein
MVDVMSFHSQIPHADNLVSTWIILLPQPSRYFLSPGKFSLIPPRYKREIIERKPARNHTRWTQGGGEHCWVCNMQPLFLFTLSLNTSPRIWPLFFVSASSYHTSDQYTAEGFYTQARHRRTLPISCTFFSHKRAHDAHKHAWRHCRRPERIRSANHSEPEVGAEATAQTTTAMAQRVPPFTVTVTVG